MSMSSQSGSEIQEEPGAAEPKPAENWPAAGPHTLDSPLDSSLPAVPRGGRRIPASQDRRRDPQFDPQSGPQSSGTAIEGRRPSGFERAMGAMRFVLPFVKRALPLLDGNLAAAVSGVLAPPSKQAPPPDLRPVEENIADLQLRQRALQDQLTSQQTAFQRVEDQIELIRQAIGRGSIERQELRKELKSISRKGNIALVLLAVLLAAALAHLFLYLRIQHLLP